MSKKKTRRHKHKAAQRENVAGKPSSGTVTAPEPMSAKQDEILARRKEVWALRLKGRQVREIAEQLKVGVGTVHRDLEAVRAELDDRVMQFAEVERAVGAARLDTIAFKIFNAIDEVVVPGDLPTLANALVRIEERRAKLLGLDKPYETIVHQTDASPEEARRLMAEKFGRTARQDSDADRAEADEANAAG